MENELVPYRNFIPYEQALALKELGFDNLCSGIYLMKNFRYCNPSMSLKYTTEGIDILGPTFSQAFKWIHNNYGFGYTFGSGGYTIINKENFIIKDVNTRKNAEIKCLKNLIEIIKEKK